MKAESADPALKPWTMSSLLRGGIAALLTLGVVGGERMARAEEAAAECQRVIVSGDPEYPPLSWDDGHTLQGAAIEIVTHALDRIGLHYELQTVGPFPRVLLAARAGTIDIVAEMKNTAERREYIEYPQTAIFQNPIAVFVRRGSTLRYQEWSDLIGKRGGMTQGNRFGGGFDEYLVEHLSVEEATRVEYNFAKLEHDRIDYFVTGYYPGMNWLMQTQREDDFEALKPWVVATDNFPGWSKRSPCLSRLREFDGALAAMVRSGEAEHLLRASIAAWRARGGKPLESVSPRAGG